MPAVDPIFYAKVSILQSVLTRKQGDIGKGIEIAKWFLACVFNRFTTNADASQHLFERFTHAFIVHDIPPPYNGQPMWESKSTNVLPSRGWRLIRPSAAVEKSVLYPPPVIILKNDSKTLKDRGM